jgi:hypothetical protein
MTAMAEAPKSPADRARRSRNVALALVLGFLVILFFVMTIVRMGGTAGAG